MYSWVFIFIPVRIGVFYLHNFPGYYCSRHKILCDFVQQRCSGAGLEQAESSSSQPLRQTGLNSTCQHNTHRVSCLCVTCLEFQCMIFRVSFKRCSWQYQKRYKMWFICLTSVALLERKFSNFNPELKYSYMYKDLFVK